MDKYQAIQDFWSSFDIPAYDVSTVPDDVKPPYITYGVSVGAIDSVLMMIANVWYRDTSWAAISAKVDEIAQALGQNGYHSQKIDGGYLWMTQGGVFAQRVDEPDDDMIRRYYLQVNAEFLTAY